MKKFINIVRPAVDDGDHQTVPDRVRLGGFSKLELFFWCEADEVKLTEANFVCRRLTNQDQLPSGQ